MYFPAVSARCSVSLQMDYLLKSNGVVLFYSDMSQPFCLEILLAILWYERQGGQKSHMHT